MQNLDGAANFVIAADHRIQLGLLGQFGQIDGVFLQRLASIFCIGVGNRLAAAQIVDRFFHGALDHAAIAQQFSQTMLPAERCEHKQLAGYELVAPVLGQLVHDIEQAVQLIGNMHLAGRPLDLRQPVDRLAQLRAQQVDIGARLGEQVPYAAALLIQQRDHQVHRFDKRVVATERQ